MSDETNNDENTAANDEPQTSPAEENGEAKLDEVNAEIEAELMDEMDAEAAEQEQQSETEQLKAQVATANDQVLRVQAEMQNVRRRAERDVENAHKYALDKFAADLLPVVDNLERALAAIDSADEGQKAVAEGLELTLKSFMEVLVRYKIEAIDPAGEPFDAELHQAVSMVPNPDLEHNTVMDVFQKGYSLNGRLVRPAMVVVSQA
ncbi:nucleotide exchange factor GrpE [Porticoccaceae bacterium]|nr:nucleotide exchange factor GrpE [Porticoccaceae bacterium]MDA9919305.1 nucleotide exchange factor GrpE [Porticoccaceae bacterium]MDB2594429.1 nucleotide exchange factor GrpE [Porticoccaceae bacterium]MDB3966243.1 nucleotide exchange factor GrpE [Porticoccaceae bacterium]